MAAKKKIGEISDDVLIIGALAIGGVYLVKNLGNLFGADPADQQAVDDQAAAPQGENPFSPLFQPFLDNWASYQPAGLSVPDGMQQLAQLGDAGQLTTGSQGYYTYTWAATIKDALSVWNWSADVNAVLAVFGQMTSQVQCASVAAFVSYVYNKDLLHWLHYGGSAIPFVPNGLSTTQVAIIVKEINNLSVY